MTKLYTSPAAKARWKAQRAPRNRTDYALVSVAKQISMPRLPSAQRAKQRRKLRDAYLLGLERNRELGINPVYRGVCERGSVMHKQWLKEAKAWDVRHQPKPDAEAA